MENLSLDELYNLIEFTTDESELNTIKKIISEKEKLEENTSATGGPSGSAGSSSVGVGGGGVALANVTTAGMGGVASSTPSHFPGALTGTAWITGGGQAGSGDIAVPYNPSGANRVFQKLPAFMKNKKNGGDPNVMTKKSRTKGFNMKTLSDLMKNKEPKGKIMNFNDFEKKDLTTKVTKLKEGRAFDVAKKTKKEVYDISKFQDMIESHVKSLGGNIKKIGSDFEIHFDNKHLGQVMFRKDYIAIQKIGNKFPVEFEYTQLKNVKDKITELSK
jgi:hypothetical protein